MKYGCPHCKQPLEIDDELAVLETSIQCPSCEQEIRIAEQSDTSATKSKTKRKHPPWKKWKWRGSIARPSGAAGITNWIGFAACAGLTYGFYVSDPRLFKMLTIISFVWLLPIGTIIYGVKAARNTFRALRFCGSRLRLLTHPGIIGGTFKAELIIRKVLPQGTTLSTTLVNQSINKYHDNQGGRSHVSITSVWKATETILIDKMPYRNGGYIFPLEYNIPSQAKDETEGSSTAGRTVGYRWRLQVKATLSGADMDLDFPVPFYHKKNIE